jgi:hypothetical protein
MEAQKGTVLVLLYVVMLFLQKGMLDPWKGPFFRTIPFLTHNNWPVCSCKSFNFFGLGVGFLFYCLSLGIMVTFLVTCQHNWAYSWTNHFNPEDGGSTFLQNVVLVFCQQDYKLLHPTLLTYIYDIRPNAWRKCSCVCQWCCFYGTLETLRLRRATICQKPDILL